MADLKELRVEIDKIDEELVKLFVRRMEISEEVAEYKRENDLPILNKSREREVLDLAASRSGKYEQYTYQLFNNLMELSKARQQELYPKPGKVLDVINAAKANMKDVFPKTGLVACQGVEGANSQAACDKLLPRGHIVYVKTFEAVFEAVSSGLCTFGVLPIENSSNGTVRGVYDLIQQKNFHIVRALTLPIRHELLAKKGAKLSDIKEIYSHEQALGQCSNYLSSLEGVKLVPCANTAVAAKMVQESGRSDIAAISSHDCAELYGLSVIAEKIQNADNNFTRFICIAKDPGGYAGANRINVMFVCDNRPGALKSVLTRVAASGVNMTKLESCPQLGKTYDFVFFMELDASVYEQGIPEMLSELESMCSQFTFLGTYTVD